MPLTIYNTLTRSKQVFEPIEPGRVRMYVCGITAYNYFHVGNARVFVVFDVVRRYLLWLGYAVKYVQNFTDIDDKILKRAETEGSTMQEIADRYIAAYFEDADRLNVLRADVYPRATQSVGSIQQLIGELQACNCAYAAGGDVYYAVRQFPGYGKLSGRKLEEMQAGASGRVEVEDEDPKKKDPFDFALWKAAKPSEPAWDSPWGSGRPGWHIECSAMVRDNLGETIDIHAGGVDLTFPHHENEIAQSEAVTGKTLAQFWMHNGFVNLDGEKMSKSIGNIRLTRDVLNAYDAVAFRLFILQAHYRKPIDFTAEAIEAAASGWKTLQEAIALETVFAQLPEWTSDRTWIVDTTDAAALPRLSSMLSELDSSAVERFNQAMDDDFNTPIALSVLFELAKDLRREGNRLVHEGTVTVPVQHLQRQWQTLVSLAQVLGLAVSKTEAEGANSDRLMDADIEQLIEQRHAARRAKNFAEADRIRDALQAQGIALIDQPGGVTRWHRS
jgi:cysteinyl-tRNA synthetase